MHLMLIVFRYTFVQRHAGNAQGRFDPENFSQEVADVAQKLVPLTVVLWNKVSAKMLPTPAKFHYLFNMRELSKVSSNLQLCTLPNCIAAEHAFAFVFLDSPWLHSRWNISLCTYVHNASGLQNESSKQLHAGLLLAWGISWDGLLRRC